jgi:spoIIIJ-associated protein
VVVDALQHMVNKVVYRERGGEKGRPLIVDAGGYRAKHVEWLQSLAKRMADKAIDTKQVVELSPMSAYDRRVVHMALADLPGVSTRSEGEGDDRHLCIIPDAR